MDRPLTYFASDVHLGLDVARPQDREARFVAFLRGIPAEKTEALYLLGDIWDFWYEYRDVVPKGYVRVFSALLELMDAGVAVYFFPGNHDVWAYSYFRELGIRVVEQPLDVTIGRRRFCLGHGDGLGPGMTGYKILRGIFHCHFLQRLFSTLHPWIAFRFGNNWSKGSRLAKNVRYTFQGETEPLYRWCLAYPRPVDTFLFGHYHDAVCCDLPSGAQLRILGDWIASSAGLCYDAEADRFLSPAPEASSLFWGREPAKGEKSKKT